MAENLVGRTLGAYQIEAEIGVSRWGGVYRATQSSMNRTVALKTVSAEMAAVSGRTTHFLEEMQAAAQISHSNIVTIYEAGCIDGINFCAMEYINGPALADFLRNGKVVDEQHLLQTIHSVARALDFLWQKKIPHQPLEAKNILVDARGTVKLINVLPLDNMPVESMKDDMLTVGLVLANLANSISPVTKRTGELVERMVAAAGRKPFISLADLAQTAADLERELFPPPSAAGAATPAPEKKINKVGLVLAILVGIASASGLYWWRTAALRQPPPVTRPADFGTMARVPGGTVGKKNVKDFFLDRYPVTIGDYKIFLDAVTAGVTLKEHTFAPRKKNHTPDNWDKILAGIQQGRPLDVGNRQLWLTWDSPVIGVDWYDAYAYANWRGKRLPSDEEWDRATRQSTQTPAPAPTNQTEVYANPADKSPDGISGLTGKLSQWIGTSPTHSTAIIRGGRQSRTEINRETRSDTVGFRCAADKEVK
ncbi:MAG: Hercynine oxygenase [Verrucomicrobiae bacterium]|nr:Hercynine oxygenase [Verrucomicrobiae bacterium]